MRALVQRVREASVAVDGAIAGAIGPGLLVLAGIGADDTDDEILWIAKKVVDLRVFDDDAGVMNRSLREIGVDPRRVAVHALRLGQEGQPAVMVFRGSARGGTAALRRLRP